MGLLVKPEVALKQIDAEVPAPDRNDGATNPHGERSTLGNEEGGPAGGKGIGVKPTARPRRYHGTVSLDPARVGRDAGRIADEVIAHLEGLVGSTVMVTLEIEAVIPAGAPDQVVRIVTENGRTLMFSSQGFESDGDAECKQARHRPCRPEKINAGSPY